MVLWILEVPRQRSKQDVQPIPDDAKGSPAVRTLMML
jgi:hypothetical protein